MTGPRQPLNVLYVGTLPPHPGGSAISGAQLVVGLARRGHRVRALAPIALEGFRHMDGFAARHRKIPVTRFPVPFFLTATNRGISDEYLDAEARGIAERLPGLIAAERPDVVFVGREALAFHVPDQLGSIPSVLRTAGGMAIGLLNGTLPPGQLRYLLRRMREMTRVVSPARHLAEGLRGAGLANVEVIPNAVDLRRFRPRPPDPNLRRRLGIAPGDVVVMHVSNLKTMKRALDIGRSARQALARDARLLYVIVGDGPDRQPLEELCRREGIAGRFRFVGWIDYSRMPRVIALANLVVMPCDFDTLARVYLESQACGRVLVASDNAGAREVVTHGETGLLFPKGDVAALTAATLHAAADAALRRRIGHWARVRVAVHDVEAALDAWIALLARVAGVDVASRTAIGRVDAGARSGRPVGASQHRRGPRGPRRPSLAARAEGTVAPAG